MLKQIVYTVIATLLLTFVATTVFTFLGIGFEMYGNYLLWFIALAIFFSILPRNINSVFG